MIQFFTRLGHRLEQRARFMATRDEIARMPQDVAFDLGIYPGDADRMAHEAVYGRA